MGKAVVTGGAGFIGSRLTRRLIREGYEVTVIDDFSTGCKRNLDLTNVETVSWLKLPYLKCDVLFHLGMPSSSPLYRFNPQLVNETVKYAVMVCEYAKHHNVNVVYASSSSLYNGNFTPFNEEMPVYVSDFYTEARYYVERLFKIYSLMYDVESVGLRLFSVYGRGEESKGEYANMISQFLWRLLRDESEFIFGDGTQTRDFVYVGDVVEAFMLASKKRFKSGVFNVGTGVSYSFNDVWKLLNERLKKNVKPSYIPNPLQNYVQDTLADTWRARSQLGFEAKTSLEQGIEKLISE